MRHNFTVILHGTIDVTSEQMEQYNQENCRGFISLYDFARELVEDDPIENLEIGHYTVE